MTFSDAFYFVASEGLIDSYGVLDLFMIARDFPRPNLGPNIGPFPIQNGQKLPKMVYIIPNFLVVHFGENFMKMRTKIAKLQMHENLHKNVNENMFLFTFLCKFS